MSFQEDFEEFLDVEQGFAITAKVTPAGGLPYIIKGILTNDYYAVDVGEAGIAGCVPAFECAEEEVEEVEYGDQLTIRRIKYKVIEIKPDGTGWIVLRLERQEN